jgi:acyl-CoA thioesterase-1
MFRNRITFAVSLLVIAMILTVPSLAADKQAPAKKKPRRPNPVFAPVKDNPKLPRVLLIGDSISIGYTLSTRKLLAGKANLHRVPTNGGPTIRGLELIDSWLGDGEWDVIHFNWGLHDLRRDTGKHQVPIEQYEKNMQTLVKRLKKTGARLIWCSTTPVPKGAGRRTSGDEVKYNAVALRVMKEHNVTVNDLYAFAMPKLAKIQRPANVHFTPEGSAELAKAVAAAIEKQLK